MSTPTISRRDVLITGGAVVACVAAQKLWDLGSELLSSAVQATKKTTATPNIVGPYQISDNVSVFKSHQVLVDQANERILRVNDDLVKSSHYGEMLADGASLNSAKIDTVWGQQTPITAGLQIKMNQTGLIIVDKFNSEPQEHSLDLPKGSLISINKILLKFDGVVRDALLIISSDESETGAKLLLRKRDGKTQAISINLDKKDSLTGFIQEELRSHLGFVKKLESDESGTAYKSYSEETARDLNANPKNLRQALPLKYHHAAIKRYQDEVTRESTLLKQIES